MVIYQYIFLEGDSFRIDTIQSSDLDEANRNAYHLYLLYCSHYNARPKTYSDFADHFKTNKCHGEDSDKGWFDISRNNFVI